MCNLYLFSARLLVEQRQTNPVYMNMMSSKITLNGTSGTAAFESNEVTGTVDTCLKRNQHCSPLDSLSAYDNDYTDDWMASSRPNFLKRSSLSSVHVKLPPLPESAEAAEEKLRRRESQETVRYGTVMGKDRSNDYMTTSCIERQDPLLSSHDYTFINQTVNTSTSVYESETTGEDECESEGVGTQENGCHDELVPREVTLKSKEIGEHKELDEEEVSHGILSTDPGCDAATRDIANTSEKKPADCDYEAIQDKYTHRRAASYKDTRFHVIETQR